MKCNLEIVVVTAEKIRFSVLTERIKKIYPCIELKQAYSIADWKYNDRKDITDAKACETDSEIDAGRIVTCEGEIRFGEKTEKCGIQINAENNGFAYNLWREVEAENNELMIAVGAEDTELYDAAVNLVMKVFSDCGIVYAAVGCEMYVKNNGKIFDIITNSAGAERWIIPQSECVDSDKYVTKSVKNGYAVLERCAPQVKDRALDVVYDKSSKTGGVGVVEKRCVIAVFAAVCILSFAAGFLLGAKTLRMKTDDTNTVVDYPLVEYSFCYYDDFFFVYADGIYPTKEYHVTDDSLLLEKYKDKFSVLTFPAGGDTTPNGFVAVYVKGVLLKEIEIYDVCGDEDTALFIDSLRPITDYEVEKYIGCER